MYLEAELLDRPIRWSLFAGREREPVRVRRMAAIADMLRLGDRRRRNLVARIRAACRVIVEVDPRYQLSVRRAREPGMWNLQAQRVSRPGPTPEATVEAIRDWVANRASDVTLNRATQMTLGGDPRDARPNSGPRSNGPDSTLTNRAYRRDAQRPLPSYYYRRYLYRRARARARERTTIYRPPERRRSDVARVRRTAGRPVQDKTTRGPARARPTCGGWTRGVPADAPRDPRRRAGRRPPSTVPGAPHARLLDRGGRQRPGELVTWHWAHRSTGSTAIPGSNASPSGISTGSGVRWPSAPRSRCRCATPSAGHASRRHRARPTAHVEVQRLALSPDRSRARAFYGRPGGIRVAIAVGRSGLVGRPRGRSRAAPTAAPSTG